MPFNLADFPKHAAAKLSRFLDYKSLLQMREISKDAMEFVDTSIHCTWVPSFGIQGECVSSDITLSFVMPDQNQYFLWESCLKYAIQRLNVHYLSDKGGMYSYRHTSRLLTVVLKKQQLREFLECVKFCLHGANIRVLKIEALPNEIVDIFSNYIKPAKIIEMHFNTSNSNAADFFPWLDFIKKFDIDTFDYITQMLKKEDIEFLQQIPSRVIQISVYNYEYKSVDTVSCVQKILSGECNGLILTSSFISIEDIAKLLQSFHGMDKEVHLLTYTDAEPMEAHIGLYKVSVREEPIPRKISIKNLINNF